MGGQGTNKGETVLLDESLSSRVMSQFAVLAALMSSMMVVSYVGSELSNL